MSAAKVKNLGGRPAHKPDARSRRVVEMLAGLAVPQEKISEVLAVDRKTLARHYASELQRGAALIEASLCSNLLRLASGNDATALRAICFVLRTRFGWSEYTPPKPEPPVGKKERQHATRGPGSEGEHRNGTTFSFNEDDPRVAARRGAPLAHCLVRLRGRRRRRSHGRCGVRRAGERA